MGCPGICSPALQDLGGGSGRVRKAQLPKSTQHSSSSPHRAHPGREKAMILMCSHPERGATSSRELQQLILKGFSFPEPIPEVSEDAQEHPSTSLTPSLWQPLLTGISCSLPLSHPAADTQGGSETSGGVSPAHPTPVSLLCHGERQTQLSPHTRHCSPPLAPPPSSHPFRLRAPRGEFCASENPPEIP